MFALPFYRQLSFLRIGSGGIKRINTQWNLLGVSQRIRSKFIVGGRDWVVRPGSAGFYKENPNIATLPWFGHFDIHKPSDEKDDRFAIFKTEILKICNDIIKSISRDEADENTGEDDDYEDNDDLENHEDDV